MYCVAVWVVLFLFCFFGFVSLLYYFLNVEVELGCGLLCFFFFLGGGGDEIQTKILLSIRLPSPPIIFIDFW